MSVAKIIAIVLRREVLLALLTIGFASASVGMVTYAYFADADGSQGNTVQAGTLDLSLDGSDSLSSTFSITNGKPGDATSHNYTLQNTGSIAADHVEIAISFVENDPSGAEPSDSDLAAALTAAETASLIEVTQLEYQNEAGVTVNDVLAGTSDANGNGIKDLHDVNTQSSQTDDLAPPQANSGNSTHFVIAVAVANDDDGTFTTGGYTAGNLTGNDEDIMADGIDVKITFTLNQDASQ